VDRRKAKVEGEKLQADIFRQISDGATVDMSDVWDKVDDGHMTTTQALKIQSHIKARDSADYKYDSTKITNATGFTDQQKTEMTLELLDAKTKQGLQGNEMHTFTDKMLGDASKRETTNYIDNMYQGVMKFGGGYYPTTPQTTTPKVNKVGTQSFTDGGKTYHIPADKVKEFKQDHPNASTN